MGSRALTDWHFAHDGWSFVVGALCNPEADYWDVIGRTRHVLDTWEWLGT